MIIPYYVVFVWGTLVVHSAHAYDTKAECDAFALEYTASHAGSAGSDEPVYAFCEMGQRKPKGDQ